MGALIGLGAIALIGAGLLVKGSNGKSLLSSVGGSSVPVPSDASLVTKYGLTNPKYHIQAMAAWSLANLSMGYSNPGFPYYEKTCSGAQSGPNGGLEVGLNVGTRLASAIPVVGPAISDAIQFVAGIFNHHAQAAAREQGALCSASNAFNQTMASLEQTIAAGGLNISTQLVPAYVSLLQEFVSWTAPVAQGCGVGKGNEACVLRDIARAILEKRAAQLGVAQDFMPASVGV